MENRPSLNRPTAIVAGAIFYSLWSPFAVFAKQGGDIRNELPTPFSVQAVSLKKNITLSWQWQPPEEQPIFEQFGYEIKRQDGKTFQSTDMSYSDAGLFQGTYTYSVRARGVTKEKGKTITYVSDWSEPVQGTITFTCPKPPTVELQVEPTQKRYSSIPSLRFHIQGQANVDSGCTLSTVTYRMDTGAGIVHTGPLPVDAKGHFDTFFNAFGPEDEIPSGRESFSVTATAKDEAGPTTSSAYAIEIELKNPFAPDNPPTPE